MEYKIIHTDNYLLVVDEDVTQAKEGAWIVRSNIEPILCDAHFFFDFKEPYKKIIAHLPINSPILEGVDLLPPLEDDVEKLADEIVGDSIYYEEDRVNLSDGMDLFILGYNKAKETYKYTEEDLRKAINLAYVSGGGGDTYQECEAFVMEQLQKELPIAFECETEKVFGVKTPDFSEEVKTTTNHLGQTVWLGKYNF